MAKEKTVEMILGGVILAVLAFLGWVGVNLVEVKSTHTALLDDLDATTKRVDRIVQQVPTLRREIALFEANTPPRQVIVATVPYRRDSLTSLAVIHEFDLTTSRSTSYYFTLSNVEVRLFQNAVRGAVLDGAPSALSFATIIDLAADSSVPTRVPAFVNANSSFVVWSMADSAPTGWTAFFKVDSTRKSTLRPSFDRTLAGIVEHLSTHPNSYTP
jgi:hypothetical protein